MPPVLTALVDTAGLSLVLPALLPAFAFLAASLFFLASLTIAQGRQAAAPTRVTSQQFSSCGPGVEHSRTKAVRKWVREQPMAARLGLGCKPYEDGPCFCHMR